MNARWRVRSFQVACVGGCSTVLGLLLLLAVASPAGADPRALERFSSFELGDQGPVFTAENGTATFTGGASARIGIPSLYHDGIRSWRVPANGMTIIDFDPPAEIVELMAIDQAGNNAAMTARTMDGSEVGTINITGSFPSPPGNFGNPYAFQDIQDGIATLTVTNGSGDAWLDSFGFTPLPEPASATGGLAALVTLFSLARRAHRVSLRHDQR